MATIAHPCFALDCLVSELSKKDAHSLSDFTNALSRSTAQDAIIKTQTSAQALTSDSSCPLFVTYNTLLRDGSTRLRGCIGTFSGGPLEQTIKQYALIAYVQPNSYSLTIQGSYTSMSHFFVPRSLLVFSSSARRKLTRRSHHLRIALDWITVVNTRMSRRSVRLEVWITSE